MRSVIPERIKAVSISFPMQSTDRDWNRRNTGNYSNDGEFLRGGMAEDLEIYLDDLEKKLRNGGKNTLVLSTILLTEIGAAVYKVIYMAIGECGVEVLQKKYSMQQMREMERMAENFQIIKGCVWRLKNAYGSEKEEQRGDLRAGSADHTGPLCPTGSVCYDHQ